MTFALYITAVMDDNNIFVITKKQCSYSWEYQPKGYYDLPTKIEWIKKHKLWQQVRDNYIDKKNANTDDNKKSRSIFSESIHQVCQQNGYYQ